MKKEEFSEAKIADVKTSDAKLFLIKMQSDGKGYSTVKSVRGVLRPAFQMAVDDDILNKNPFEFQLAGVVVNDSHTRTAITREQMRQFLKFVQDDNCYCKYYEVVYILFHTGMRISEFCGLTLKDIDLKNRIVNIDHQLAEDIGYAICNRINENQCRNKKTSDYRGSGKVFSELLLRTENRSKEKK